MRLVGWQKRRKDKKTEEYWRNLEKTQPLNGWEQYQKEWNFIETDYDEAPSNNSLDVCNPGFHFDTYFTKYIVVDEMKTNTAEVLIFPTSSEATLLKTQNGGKLPPPNGIEIFIVFSIEKELEDGRKLAMVDGAFASEDDARDYIESRDTRHGVSYEIEKHILGWHKYYE